MILSAFPKKEDAPFWFLVLGYFAVGVVFAFLGTLFEIGTHEIADNPPALILSDFVLVPLFLLWVASEEKRTEWRDRSVAILVAILLILALWVVFFSTLSAPGF